MTGPHILPAPRSYTPGKASFQLGRAVRLILPPGADDHDRFAARQLGARIDAVRRGRAILEQRWDIEPAAPAVVLLRADRDAAFAARCGIELPALPAQGYRLVVEPALVTIIGADAPGLFYGAVTLSQMIDGDAVACGTVDDAPALPVRGVMHDVSRGKVPTLETLYGLVDDLAGWKVNHLQLYTEHAFRFRKHPLIGRDAGPLTPEQMIALDEYCRARHVMLVPNLATFGHMHPILTLKPYRHLAEDEARAWCLNPLDEGSYALLDDLLGELLPNFSAPLFNANCDETYGLGEQKSKPRADEIGVGRLYLEHIQRLHRLVTEKYGRRMMMWGDIIVKYPDLIAELPEDMICLDWWYEATRDWDLSKRFADAGREFYVCPGTSSWNGLFPRVANACGNIRNFAAAGHQYGATGMLNTDWGDGGHYNLLGYSYHGFAYGAQAAWNPEFDDDAFDAGFGALTFGEQGGAVAQAIRLLGEANDRVGIPIGNASVTLRFLREATLTGKHLRQAEPEKLRAAQEAAREAGELLRGAQGKRSARPDLTAELLFAAEQVAWSLDKATWTAETRAGWAAGNNAWFAERGAALRELRGDLGRQKKRFESLWLARAVPAGLADNLARYDEVAADLRAAEATVRAAHATVGAGEAAPALPDQ